jgi:hypothetical protein
MWLFHWCREGESNPQGTKYRRILSSTVRSEPLGKFLTLSDSSTAYQHADSSRHDPFCRVLNMELLQFYYSCSSDRRRQRRHDFHPGGRVDECNRDICAPG